MPIKMQNLDSKKFCSGPVHKVQLIFVFLCFYKSDLTKCKLAGFKNIKLIIILADYNQCKQVLFKILKGFDDLFQKV